MGRATPWPKQHPASKCGVVRRSMLHVVVPAFVFGFSFLFQYIVCHVRTYQQRKDIAGVKRALFVIAHPDDECMFFGPTIIQMKRRGCELHLLCLSSGNFSQQGHVRKEELRKSCEILGINPSYVTIVEHTNMPDNPKAKWREDLVATIVLKHIIQLDIDTVITFDNGGISGHNNHISLYCGLSYLCKEGLLPSSCKAFTLESVNLLRKYIGILDVPWSFINTKYAYVSSQKDISIAQRAISAHSSQMLWFRWLYVYSSRYMIINTFQQLQVDDDVDSDELCDSDLEKLD